MYPSTGAVILQLFLGRRLLTKKSVNREIRVQARNNHGQEILRDRKTTRVPLKEMSKMSNQFLFLQTVII